MPAKKAVKATDAAETEVKTVKKAAKKTTAKKTAEDTAETTTVKKAAAKKTATVKKTAAKKAEAPAAEEKAPAKKTVKKTATKKTAKKAEEKVEVVKRTVKDYEDIINWKKGEAHAMDWLYIEINAGDLLNEAEPCADNIQTAVNAVRDAMLEGDQYLNDSDSADLTVRYYCDNLSPDRRKYSE